MVPFPLEYGQETPMKILLADDEKDFAYALAAILEKNKMTVDFCFDGPSVFDYLAQNHYDAIVLDVMMPGMDGFEVLRKIRIEKISTPVLFLTAKNLLEDKLKGLDLGADDYLTKPFSSEELLARLRAIIRRDKRQASNEVRFGDLSLDLDSALLSCGEKSLSLPKKEFQILSLLMLSPNKRQSSEAIYEAIYDLRSAPDSGSIWVYLSSLRKNLKSLGSNVEIDLQRGVGYCLKEKKDV